MILLPLCSESHNHGFHPVRPGYSHNTTLSKTCRCCRCVVWEAQPQTCTCLVEVRKKIKLCYAHCVFTRFLFVYLPPCI